jgi:hypothetical protein
MDSPQAVESGRRVLAFDERETDCSERRLILKRFHRGIIETVLFLALILNFSCSHQNNDNPVIVNIINNSEKKLLEFQIPGQEVTVHENFQKYKIIKLKLVKKYFSNQDYRMEKDEIGKIKSSLNAIVADLYSANIDVFNNKMIEVILGESENKNILKTRDIKLLKEI